MIEPLLVFFHRMFFTIKYDDGDGDQGIPFSSLEEASAYVPTVSIDGEEFICAALVDIQPTNKPPMIRCLPGDIENLSAYIPEKHLIHVLPVVKYFGIKDIDITFDDSFRKNYSAFENQNPIGKESLLSDYRLVEVTEGIIEKQPDPLPSDLRDKLRVRRQPSSVGRFTEPKKIPSYREANSILMEKELY